MTEEEVQQIYDYLHENYRYENGEMIRKKDAKTGIAKQGYKPGCVKTDCNKSHIYMSVEFNSIRKTSPISYFIYLYHTKIWPERLMFKDGNPINSSFDNLLISNKREIELLKTESAKGYYARKMTDGSIKFEVHLHTMEGGISLGIYKTKEQAAQVYKVARNLSYYENMNNKDLQAYIKKYKLREFGSEFKGYSWDKNKWQVKLYHKGKCVFRARFEKEDEARIAYLKAKEEYA